MRNILIRNNATRSETLLPEARIGQEEMLQETLKNHPELIPAADFGLGELLVVGREVSAGNGFADMLCIDSSGQIAIVEMKRGPENPDSRRVIAQVLEYGAHFWQMDASAFEQRALAYFASTRCDRKDLKHAKSLQEAMNVALGYDPAEESDVGTPELLTAIGENLDQGRFIYLVVTRHLDPALRQVISYLNATTNFHVGGVEVDYFAEGDRELFIPRAIGWQTAARSRSPATGRTDRERFLQDVTPNSRDFFERLFASLEELGFVIQWGAKGCACRFHNSRKLVSFMQCYPQTVWWLTKKHKDEISAVLKGTGDAATQSAFQVWEEKLRVLDGWREKKNGIDMYIDGDSSQVLITILDAARDVASILSQ